MPRKIPLVSPLSMDDPILAALDILRDKAYEEGYRAGAAAVRMQFYGLTTDTDAADGTAPQLPRLELNAPVEALEAYGMSSRITSILRYPGVRNRYDTIESVLTSPTVALLAADGMGATRYGQLADALARAGHTLKEVPSE
jgi:hypothetical protein